MPRGPQEARLERAVSGATRSAIQTAEEEWRNGARSLDNVAMALEMAGPQVIANFGGTHTGPAAQQAFQKVAEKVRARKEQMEQAAEALARADVALGEAQQVRASLGALPSEPARPDIAPGTNDADAVRQQRTYATQMGSFHAAMADREAKAEAAANEMDRAYRDSTATMERVHGEPDARSGGPGASGGAGADRTSGGTSSGGGTVTSATGAAGAAQSGNPAPGIATTGQTHVVAPAGATPAVLTAPGTAQDGTALAPPSGPSATIGASSPASTTGPTGAGVAGGLAGALGGGLLGGAAGIGGAVRGGTTGPVSTAATAGRSIGSSARTAAAGTLGRGGATATPGSAASTSRPGATTARAAANAATGRAGSASAGRPGGVAGSAGTAGARGQAGAATKRAARLGPRGAAMVSARGGQHRDEDRHMPDDLFESPQDWVDDEDAAPGVID